MKALLSRNDITYLNQLHKVLSLPEHPEWIRFASSFIESVPQYGNPLYDSRNTSKESTIQNKSFLRQLEKSWIFFQEPHHTPHTIHAKTAAGGVISLSYHLDKMHGKLSLFILQEDRPFIVETLKNMLQKDNLVYHSLFHPVFKVGRDTNRVLTHIYTSKEMSKHNNSYESLISINIDWKRDTKETQLFLQKIIDRFQLLHQATHDWPRMRKMIQILFQKKQHPEWDYIDWLCQDHFLFLGTRLISPASPKLRTFEKQQKHIIHPESFLGLFKDETIASHPSFLYKGWRPSHGELSFNITKTPFRSPIHRPSRIDLINIWDEKNKHVLQLIGVFTRKSYLQPKSSIPIIKTKIAHLFESFDLQPNWHDGKRLKMAMESIPHDEYWHFSKESLQIACSLLLQSHTLSLPIMLSNISKDKTSVTIIIFLGRDRYSVTLKDKMGELLETFLNGTLTSMRGIVDDAPFARMIFVINYSKNILSDNLWKEKENILQSSLSLLSLTWDEHFSTLKEQEKKLNVFSSLRFDPLYQKNHTVEKAIHDSVILSQLNAKSPYASSCHFSKNALEETFDTHLEVRLFSLHEPLALFTIIDLLKNAGIVVHQEHTYPIQVHHKTQGENTVYIHHCLGQIQAHSLPLNIEKTLNSLLISLLHKKRPNDGFNQLLLSANLSLKQIDLCRMYSEFMQQIGYAYSADFISKTLTSSPILTHILLKTFHARFAPNTAVSLENRLNKTDVLKKKLDKSLETISSFEEDQLFRDVYALIMATTRTNYYLKRDYISLKFDSSKIPRLVDPKPAFEVFVSSPLMKGVHLRSSKVARGGIRYSDRPQDVRNEILQLMQAQTLKNAIIVPTGAKGGFIVKKENPSKQEIFHAYKTLLSGLLDITDNRENQKSNPSPPVGIVAFDDADPYLVVAADKGTATFSDGANTVANTYNFWLKDAFASGGGHGYDHKKLGITARGAFVSVEHHFSKKGVDIQKDPFTVIGVGDMSGDVFGNGMLLSKHIKLLAAFNHQHIFLDPSPHLEKSFEERHRLFHLSQSSWKDYNLSALSKGGQIFERSQKVLTLSPENQERFGLCEKITPTDLIRSLLGQKIDLLWFGGIGTYIQGEEEDYRGDPQNDLLRLRASNINARIIGEGANLGLTPLARIDLAKNGCLLNSDAIDNAGGVNCSDREVNLKMLLSHIPFNERNEALHLATANVVELILKDNLHQNKALDHLEKTAQTHYVDYLELLNLLEKNVPFKRRTVFLEKDVFLKQFRTTLTRPELAILMSYSKLWLKNYIQYHGAALFNDYSHDSLSHHLMKSYFPACVFEQYRDIIPQHSLFIPLCSLVLSNQLVDEKGILWLTPLLQTQDVQTLFQNIESVNIPQAFG